MTNTKLLAALQNPIAHRSAQMVRRNVFGPDGRVLTLDNLPAPKTERWVVRRKAEVVAAVRGGLLSFGEACERYALTAEEFMAWQDAISHSGLDGLRVTRPREFPHKFTS